MIPEVIFVAWSLVAVPAVSLNGEIGSDDLHAAVRAEAPDLEACWEPAWATAAEGVRLVLKLEVKRGRVRGVSANREGPIATCVTAKAAAWTFPRSAKDQVGVVVDLTVPPSAAVAEARGIGAEGLDPWREAALGWTARRVANQPEVLKTNADVALQAIVDAPVAAAADLAVALAVARVPGCEELVEPGMPWESIQLDPERGAVRKRCDPGCAYPLAEGLLYQSAAERQQTVLGCTGGALRTYDALLQHAVWHDVMRAGWAMRQLDSESVDPVLADAAAHQVARSMAWRAREAPDVPAWMAANAVPVMERVPDDKALKLVLTAARTMLDHSGARPMCRRALDTARTKAADPEIEAQVLADLPACGAGCWTMGTTLGQRVAACQAESTPGGPGAPGPAPEAAPLVWLATVAARNLVLEGLLRQEGTVPLARRWAKASTHALQAGR